MLDILISAYKPGEYLSRILSSLRSQTVYKQLCVYVLLDGQDELEEVTSICCIFEALGLNIKLFYNEKNEGRNITKQRLVDYSNNQWFMFMDQDDVIMSPVSLEQMLLELDDSYDVIYTKFWQYNGTEDNYDVFNYTFLHGKIYNRKFVTDNKCFFYPGVMLGEDYYFNLRIRMKKPKIKNVDYQFYLWTHDNELSVNGKASQNKSAAASIICIIWYFLYITREDWEESGLYEESIFDVITSAYFFNSFLAGFSELLIEEYNYWCSVFVKKFWKDEYYEYPMFLSFYHNRTGSFSEKHQEFRRTVPKLSFREWIKKLQSYDINYEAIKTAIVNDEKSRDIAAFCIRQRLFPADWYGESFGKEVLEGR